MKNLLRPRGAASLLLLAMTLGLGACGGGSGSDGDGGGTVGGGVANPPPVVADGQGRPAPECGGAPRAGQTYDVTIPSPLGDGETIAATVFEPTLLDGCQTYPLVLVGSGFGSPRMTGEPSTDPQNNAFLVFSPVPALTAAGFGAISFDHRAHGESGGKIRVQDPDYEGANVIRVVDWAEANLDWLAYGPSADGSDPHNLKLGAVGPSYGGGYQLMLLAIDPKRRLDAIVPSVTWNDLVYSLTPGGVIKDGWVRTLADGKEEQFDPYINQQLQQMYADNAPGTGLQEAMRYHSLKYFCDGQGVATNGGPGTHPLHPPLAPPKINALLIQSSRDTLFNLNEGVDNYNCLKTAGGDVRLFTVQAGHNTLGIAGTLGVSTVPEDPGVIYQPDPTSTGISCGGVTTIQAVLAWFQEYLQDMGGTVDTVLGSQPICLSLTAIDSVPADTVERGGQSFDIAADAPGNTVTVGVDDSQATTVPLLTLADAPMLLAGIPTLDVTLTDVDNPGNTDDRNTIIFVGIGQKHLGGLTPWDLVDNQLTPLRGLGRHQVDLSGVLERVLPGDQIGLMLFGANANQYETTGVRDGTAFAVQVRVQGSVALPLQAVVAP
ncbi:MAG: CocE/NonD family hydrolase [Nevskiales bacterium]|nr:CocE/NonD family hydrolase [Nevskiales bacterium]